MTNCTRSDSMIPNVKLVKGIFFEKVLKSPKCSQILLLSKPQISGCFIWILSHRPTQADTKFAKCKKKQYMVCSITCK